MSLIQIYDNVLPDPVAYRKAALELPFSSYHIEGDSFHGIAFPSSATDLLLWIAQNTDLYPQMTFFRKSPQGQIEPNFIHHDLEMGGVTGIFYLNPDAPDGDGTDFWRHRGTGDTSAWRFGVSKDGWLDIDKWELIEHVPAQFNRLLLFDSDLFHSRAIKENYGTGAEARLIQVVFA